MILSYRHSLITLLFLSIPMISVCFAENNVVFGKERVVSMDESLKLTVDLNKKNYVFEEPITIKCKIENLKEEVVNLKLLLSSDISVYLRHKEEQAFSRWDSFLLPRELLNKSSIKKIVLGEPYYFEEVISKDTHTMPKKSGKYELYIMYQNGMKNLKGIKLWVGEIKSNTVEFEVQ